MTTPQPLTENTLDTIKDDLIFGYHNNNGEKQYPNVKEAAKWHKVSYDSLRKRTGKWNWQQKRQDHIDKVNRKVAQKKKEYPSSSFWMITPRFGKKPMKN